MEEGRNEGGPATMRSMRKAASVGALRGVTSSVDSIGRERSSLVSTHRRRNSGKKIADPLQSRWKASSRKELQGGRERKGTKRSQTGATLGHGRPASPPFLRQPRPRVDFQIPPALDRRHHRLPFHPRSPQAPLQGVTP